MQSFKKEETSTLLGLILSLYMIIAEALNIYTKTGNFDLDVCSLVQTVFAKERLTI